MSKTPLVEYTDGDGLSQLLKQLLVRDSELGRYLRHTLKGLYASLESARAEAISLDNSEEATLCGQLSELLDQLLKENTSNEALSNKDTSKNTNSENLTDFKNPGLILQDFCNDFFTDKKLYPYIGDSKPRSTNDSDLWDEIQKLLLRVPGSMAQKWQNKALQSAKKIKAKEDDTNNNELPFSENKLLYPGLTGTVKAQGLCLSTEASLDSEINDKNLDGDLKFLAQIVSICIYFIQNDPSLHHCLKSIKFFGITRFNSQHREDYIKTLILFFKKVKDHEQDPIKSLKARLDLDEAINSLVYQPLADPNSWWCNLQKDARKTLDKAVERVNSMEGDQAGCQWLLGVRDDIIKYTENKDDVIDKLQVRGTPGKVLACLRVYAWINQEKMPGRVIFYPK
ncbi:hypothetical protein [Moorena sp. SIO3B2]|uniref:hypothetical protein n=1 Tax=Moorena sp. SIO3B2 TaxID=2607827 RepID=UPI0013CCC0B5|nr:hypothetical protein [Moorena sp. SIO3B2]NEP33808.1 hypothetical protein [Moorena sp. SIO3B2]